jgi:hypothetical protein
LFLVPSNIFTAAGMSVTVWLFHNAPIICTIFTHTRLHSSEQFTLPNNWMFSNFVIILWDLTFSSSD